MQYTKCQKTSQNEFDYRSVENHAIKKVRTPTRSVWSLYSRKTLLDLFLSNQTYKLVQISYRKKKSIQQWLSKRW